ncbi:MAG: sulfite exporter TauE/SafE family protein [Deltaproteobacteria bacterium]|nr:sulfite exporter TauE/SafE family protein [Deltaproteobacteria bacterium]MBW2541767.1 sulfite exporter TauE/SafE family protein [Deltaproteobacteria bacterium]
MSALESSLLIAVGFVAGVVNTLAGGGSLLTVPLLVLFGLPGTIANGTNRVGVLVQCLVACWRFDAKGISEFRSALPLLPAIVLGSLVGAATATQVPDSVFERIFAGIMLVLLIPMLRGGTPPPASESGEQRWSPLTRNLVLFAIGFYGGAFQAGVGLLLLFALNRAGIDLFRANSIKIVIVTALAITSVPVFVFERQVAWLPAVFISIGFTAGAAMGARIALAGGETAIRRALAVAVLALAGHLFGLY